jgi:hypothetical protein
MKKFKHIQELNDKEFEDLMFLSTDISKQRTNLNYILYAPSKCYFNKYNPFIFVFKDNDQKINACFKISSNPYILNNDFLSNDDILLIISFIKQNKNILIKNWNWKCSSKELKNKLTGIIK